jgi:hypothetical protein
MSLRFPKRSTNLPAAPQLVHRRNSDFTSQWEMLALNYENRSWQAGPHDMGSHSSSKRYQLLEWFPFYVHRLTGESEYRALKDYQQAWYLNLLFASWVSKRPGYLPDDGQLWRLANARTRQFFDKEGGPVLSMFEREGSAVDGAIWIYSRMLLEIYDEQVLKFHNRKRKSSKSTNDENTSYLNFEGTLKKENGSEGCSRHPESGLTQWGTCWACYAEKYSSQTV